MTTCEEWTDIGAERKWLPPILPAWGYRLPGIRHIRTIWHGIRAANYGAMWSSMGFINTGYDDWVLFGMWRGWA